MILYFFFLSNYSLTDRLWCGLPPGPKKCANWLKNFWQIMFRSTLVHWVWLPITIFFRSSMFAKSMKRRTSLWPYFKRSPPKKKIKPSFLLKPNGKSTASPGSCVAMGMYIILYSDLGNVLERKRVLLMGNRIRWLVFACEENTHHNVKRKFLLN